MSEREGVTRRDTLKIAIGTVAGLVIGGVAGYFSGTAVAPVKTVTTTKTTTAAATTVTTTVTAPASPTTVTVTKTVKPTPPTIPSTPLKIGLTTFLSGGGAIEGFHADAVATMLTEKINAAGGILGRKIEIVKVDEAIGAEALVKAVRKIVEVDKVEFITGLISSGNGCALAPIIEKELMVPTIYSTATTAKLFEEVDPNPKFVFRAGNYDPLECIAAARIVATHCPEVVRVAGINPDYAFGRDQWKLFTTALKKLKPDVEFVYDAWPKLGTTDFTPHISAILAAKPDLVFTSLYAGDLITFVKQAGAMGLFEQAKLVANVAGSAYPEFDKSWFPEGVIMGTRNYWFTYPPYWPLGRSFLKEYLDRFKKYPIYTSIFTYHAIMAYKTAVERAYEEIGGWPEVDDIIRHLEGLMVYTPSGYRYFRPEDHQGLGYHVIGITKHVPEYKFPILDPLYIIPPDELAPPPGVKAVDWIESW